MKDILNIITEGSKPLNEGRYWDNDGPLEKEAAELGSEVGPSGPADTYRGEIFRAAQKIYYDYYNNGFGNDWRAPAMFLMNHVDITPGVEDMFIQCAHYNMHNDRYKKDIEDMLTQVIQQAIKLPKSKNTEDMWNTDVPNNVFEPEYSDEEDYDDEDEWDDTGQR